MYNNIKSKVMTSEGISDSFECLVDVSQGENLSPFLFSIFLNDMESYLSSQGINGVSYERVIDGLRIYVKIFILLYADDTVIFCDSAAELQEALNAFKVYCDTWKLKIHTGKTKIMIIGKGRRTNGPDFKIGDDLLEQVDEYKYLGLYLSRTGSNIKTKQYLADQATKAMFSLLRKIKKFTLPFDIQIDLFEKCVKPILLYGCEIWGFGNIDVLERVQLKFYKYIFQLKKATPNYMIYGEIGILPLIVDIKTRTVSYWARIINNKDNSPIMKLNCKLYLLLNEMASTRQVKSAWIENIKHILCSNGYSGIWYSQSFSNTTWLKNSLHKN